MPHLRARYASHLIQSLGKLWPVVGILGPRQTGKTTLAHTLLGIEHSLSFDDLEVREEASRSPKTFLAKLDCPLVLDEVQKAPEIFDAIKLRVDRKRVPGSYILTGSSSFSAKLGIRESLTGRIGLMELLPMSLGELHGKASAPVKDLALIDPVRKPRLDSTEFIQGALLGGMPVPAFLREASQRESYWRSWLETTLLRDLARFFKRGYDPDLAYALLARMGAVLAQGELPTLKHFSQPAAKVRTYFSAMQEIFLLRRVQCHPEGIGKETWMLMDSGLANYLMKSSAGEGATLSLARHFLWNEWACQSEYQGRRTERVYYKSAQGSPIDAILGSVPFRIVASVTGVTRQRKIEERALLGAMKKLGSPVGYLVAPVESVTAAPKKGGIGIVPWSYWS
jgi:predicted AAA+ superfamily ATPase